MIRTSKKKGQARQTDIVGKSSAMKPVRTLIRKVADSSVTILLLGETGTGKELVARAIHDCSKRKAAPFIAVNCSALAETLLESELFGHERGAFTDAVKSKPGRFELADTGTLFLDEIGDLSPVIQVKLLRVLQEGEFQRVGGEHPLRTDTRIISATNRDLEQEVREGRFRQDLYYRIHVVRIELPPLRERKEDIPELARYFLKKLKQSGYSRVSSISPAAIKVLTEYPWPGNVRELENAIERAVVLSEDTSLKPKSFASLKTGSPGLTNRLLARQLHKLVTPYTPLGKLIDAMEEVTRLEVRAALKRTRGDKEKAARLLGISPCELQVTCKKQ